ncbi:MAG: hypothetical protein P4N59_31470 [Negativicutes bacterium]|nr:hypothetical protein [Negativicutes bacterium]
MMLEFLVGEKPGAKPSPLDDAWIRKRVKRLLATLGDAGNYDQLLAYAARRSSHLGLNVQPADLVHDAVLAVLAGLNDQQEGRHPRCEDLRDMPAFMNYLKQVIKSVATHMGRHQRHLHFTCLHPIKVTTDGSGQPSLPELEAPPQSDHNAELRDLRGELFAQLRRRAPARLRRMIKVWKKDFFWTDTIPLRGAHRQYRAELRVLARQILCEIEPALWPPAESRAASLNPLPRMIFTDSPHGSAAITYNEIGSKCPQPE